MTASGARLAEITLPDFGMPATEPLVAASIFADRLDRLRSVMETREYDHIVVWADREHSANIAYITGFDPGHQLHLDEWVNSPVFPGSTIELRSGTALQCDIIPATGTPYFTTNIEDGVALADASLRAEFAATYPEAWQRIRARRRFMTEMLGIDLHPDVLPFSNLAAHLTPFLLRPDRAMTVAH